MTINPHRSQDENDPNLRIWDKLELKFFDGDKSGLYIAKIEDMLDGGFAIDRPEWVSGEPLFAEGVSCLVTYTRPMCRYQFSSEVLSSFKNRNKLFYVLSLPESIRRIQRRRFVRVEVAMPFQLMEIKQVIEGSKKFEEVEWKEAITLNLSASGIGFYFPVEISVGSIVAVKMNIPDIKEGFQTLGRIVRCFRKNEEKWFIGMEFFTREEMTFKLREVNLSEIPRSFTRFGERDRNIVVNFIFSEEVRIRRREIM